MSSKIELTKPLETGFARWFIFIPKILVWVYFGGPWNGKCWHILWQIGKSYSQFEILGYVGAFFPFWYIVQRKSGSPAKNYLISSKQASKQDECASKPFGGNAKCAPQVKYLSPTISGLHLGPML
jgi:hypothetical protein